MNKRYKEYSELAKDFGNNIAVIEYPFNWGGQFQDKKFWCAVLLETGEAYDYHTKGTLKRDLSKDGYEWVVVRWHKKSKGFSVVESSPNLKSKEKSL